MTLESVEDNGVAPIFDSQNPRNTRPWIEEQSRQLAEDGYTLLPNILSSETLEAQDRDHFERQRSTGSLIGVQTHPWFVELDA